MSVECLAVVIRIEGDMALVETVAADSACGRCSEAPACATAGRAIAAREYRLPNRIGAQAGDRVVLDIGDGMVLRAALFAYLLPLLLLLAGAAAGHALAHDDVTALGGALIGLALGLGLLRWQQQRVARVGELLPRMRFQHPR